MKSYEAYLLFALAICALAHRVACVDKFVVSFKAETIDGIEGPYKMPGDRYVADIAIGQDTKQNLKISFDTAFNDIFVPAKKPVADGNLHFENGFNDWKSLIVREDNLEFKNSNLDGKWVSDSISLDKKQKDLKLKSLFFVANESEKNFSSESWDGIIGLGPRYIAKSGSNNTILSLKQQKIIAKAQFGIWFSPTFMKEQRMELILGDLDVKRVTDMSIIFGGFREKEHWKVHLSSVWLNQKPIGCQFKNCKAIFNSGSSATYGPKEQVYQLYEALGINTTNVTNTYVDCDKVPRNINMGFTFEARDRQWPSSYYIKESFNNATKTRSCYVTVYPHDKEEFWSMGTNFMAAYYTAYDLEREQFMIAH